MLEWKSIETREDGFIKIPNRWLYIHYYESLSVLFRIENALRIFVYCVLKNEFKEKWSDLSITSDDTNVVTINSIAKMRISQAQNFGYLGYPISCPIMHLTSGELIRIITSDSYWKHFNEYFLGNKEIMKNKLDEISIIRNALAHFRPIKIDDLDVVKQNAKHIFPKIEETIYHLIKVQNIVPSNTKDEWYINLKEIKHDICELNFYQSNNEQWIKIEIGYNCPLIKTQKLGTTFIRYDMLNVISSSILKYYSVLANKITYLSEYVPFVAVEESPKFKKNISMVFSKKMIIENHTEIKAQVEELLTKIHEESTLILEDHLAKGEIIETVNTFAVLDANNNWSLKTTSLMYNVKAEDPPEYWGDYSFITGDIFGAAHKYPWSPVHVSNLEWPY